MIDVVVGGATGRLGSLVCDLVAESDDMRLVGAIVSPNGGHIGEELYPGVFAVGPDSIMEVLKDADVYVDLTAPKAASELISMIPSTNTNLIVGTTAIDENAIREMADNTARYGTSSLVAANFALGVNVFWKICDILATHLPDYDIEIIEAHHASKKDAPSGTTKEAVKRIKAATGIEKTLNGRQGATGPREREIGIHSIRAGDIVGDHTVIFAKNMECLELTHRTISREVLAKGCVASIRWMADKKDGKVHNMKEVFDL